MSVSDEQVGGDHYRRHAIKPWDIIQAYGLDYWEGNILKYLLRAKGDKTDRKTDLLKAAHYLQKKLEMMG